MKIKQVIAIAMAAFMLPSTLTILTATNVRGEPTPDFVFPESYELKTPEIALQRGEAR